MNALRLCLFTLFAAALAYFIAVLYFQVGGPVGVFFTDMRDFSWRGMFNVDFSAYLCLSALWIAWRHQFSMAGYAIALLCFGGGCLAFIPYVLVLTFRSQGNPQEFLMGRGRSA